MKVWTSATRSSYRIASPTTTAIGLFIYLFIILYFNFVIFILYSFLFLPRRRTRALACVSSPRGRWSHALVYLHNWAAIKFLIYRLRHHGVGGRMGAGEDDVRADGYCVAGTGGGTGHLFCLNYRIRFMFVCL